MILIWFIGMYVIFILQQITIIYLFKRLEKKPPSYDVGYWIKKGLESQSGGKK